MPRRRATDCRPGTGGATYEGAVQSASLARALPDLPNVAFIDATADESKLLPVSSSDDDPGRHDRYDKATRRPNELVLARPQLADVTLATGRPISHPAADGTGVLGYLTLPPGRDGKGIPAIVMPHGGPGARDERGFDWCAQYFADRGFAVPQPDFRGSTGYARLAPAPLAVVGWSYDGYTAVLDPEGDRRGGAGHRPGGAARDGARLCELPAGRPLHRPAPMCARGRRRRTRHGSARRCRCSTATSTGTCISARRGRWIAG